MCEFCSTDPEVVCIVCDDGLSSAQYLADIAYFDEKAREASQEENVSVVKELIRDAVGTTDPIQLLNLVDKIDHSTHDTTGKIELLYGDEDITVEPDTENGWWRVRRGRTGRGEQFIARTAGLISLLKTAQIEVAEENRRVFEQAAKRLGVSTSTLELCS